MGQNAEKFIASFNRIQSYLSFLSHEEENKKPFYRLLDENEYRNSGVKQYKSELQAFADLRNVMVHKKVFPGQYIADPTDTVVEEIEKIEREIKNPNKVFPIFKREVVCFQTTDYFSKLLKIIQTHKFTHFPIYENSQLVGVLTENGIASWLANYADEGQVQFDQIKVGEILKEDEKSSNYLVIRKEMSVDVAAELLRNNQEVKALLITEEGKKEETLLGIVTPSDL
ncbi:CBS domain-containing protein [Pisciglobus halotolerans]|uniref:CBS domain-containing protein n=1 Tax=Pisciglobus halotolerans TaxID=745365 RepID=A0A1I3E144_9LACT|nr:CBS domain-containing protein [Pisciglobus halotolerans]SFH92714.1 CBS domain-containing protein [Pisciglobus halotolerans]